MPTQRGSTAVDSQQADQKEKRQVWENNCNQAVFVRPKPTRKASSPAAVDADKPSGTTRSPAKKAKSSPSPKATNKPTAVKQRREAALQQLRLQEKAQLEKLKLLTQQRRTQRLLEEQQQAEALYSFGHAVSAAGVDAQTAAHASEVVTQTSKKVSPQKRQRSPSPAVKAQAAAAATVSPPAAAARAASNKLLGKSFVKLQQLFNPVAKLPSFSSAKHGAPKASSNPAAVSSSATAHDAEQEAALLLSAGTGAAAGAEHITFKVNKETMLQHGQPAAADQSGCEQVQAQPAPKPEEPACAIAATTAKNATAYDKPWRQNMAKKSKDAGQKQQTGACSGAADAAGPLATAQLLGAAADASKPVVLKSKKRTPEQQAKLQAFMAAKYQEHLQQQLQERKRFEAAAARRQVVKQLAAQQREAARQRQLQHPGRCADTFHPEKSWRGVLTPSSEGSREAVVESAGQGQRLQQVQQYEQQCERQQQQQREQQQLELHQQHQMQQQLQWQQQQQEELQQLNAQWQHQQQQRQQQQGFSASDIPVGSLGMQSTSVSEQRPVTQQQLAQQLQPGNEMWQQYQPQQKLQRFDDQHDTSPSRGSVAHVVPSLFPGADPAVSSRQPLHNSSSPERSRKGAGTVQPGLHRSSQDVSPGTAYFKDRQAVTANNALAKRSFEQRLRAYHSAAAAPAAASFFTAACSSSNAVAAYPVAAVAMAGGRLSGGGAPRTPEKAKRLLAKALKASSVGSSSSSRKSSRTPCTAKKACTRLKGAATSAAGDDHVKQQRRHRRLQKHLAEESRRGSNCEYESSDEYEVHDESDCGPADRSPSPVRDQQPMGAAAAMPAAGDAFQQEAPLTALSHFWVQQHAADRKHASNNAMIQQLLQQSTMLKQRIERICNQALKQQQQIQQQKLQQEQRQHQQRQQGLHQGNVSLVTATAPDMSGPQQLADKLSGLLEQQRHVLDASATATGNKHLQQEQQRGTSSAHLPVQSPDSSTGSAGSHARGTCTASTAAPLERTGILSAEGSKAWQQRLRAQLLPGGFNAGMQLQEQQHQPATPAAGVAAVAQLLPQQTAGPAATGAGMVHTASASDQAMPVSQEQQQPQSPGRSNGSASNWGYDEDATSMVHEEQTAPGFLSQPGPVDAACSTCSSNSSILADHAPVSDAVLRSQMSFVGAFSHLEAAAQEVVAADVCPGMQFSRALEDNLAGSQNAVEPLGDQVVTWYSAVGGSIDFGSPEPPSPKHEDSLAAHDTMQAASREAMASIAAAEADRSFMALSNDWGEHYNFDTRLSAEPENAVQAAIHGGQLPGPADAAPPAYQGCSTGSSSHAASNHHQHPRRRWHSSTSQEQQEQEQQVHETASGLHGKGVDVHHEVLPRWASRPSWAAAGFGGYRWDTVSSSSSSDSEAASASSIMPCEQIVQQHETLQQQQQLACIPRQDKALALDLRHQAEQARQVLIGLEVESEDEDQQQLPFEKPAKGDPHSIINIFMRQHQERMQRRQQEQQQRQEQLLREEQQQQQQQQQQQDLRQLHEELKEQQPAGQPSSEAQQLATQLLALLHQEQDTPQLQQHTEHTPKQQQAQHSVSCPEARAVSPSAIFEAPTEQQQQQVAHVQLHDECPHHEDWLEQYTSLGPAQQLLLDMDGAGVFGQEQQQERRRLSPDTLQRLHKEGLAKLEIAQEAELDLLQLQQTHERVTLQQEAARVARELDQQQLFALLQQQQHAAAQEQVEQSAGLFQRVTRGLLDDTFSQLKDVSAMFVEKMHDASRRSCGVQASEAPPEAQQAVAQGSQLHLPGPHHQHLQPIQTSSCTDVMQTCRVAEDELAQCSKDGLESMPQPPPAVAAGAADCSAVLPEEQAHPILHFQGLLMAEHAVAEHTRMIAAAEVEQDNVCAFQVSDALGVPASNQLASDLNASHPMTVSDIAVQQPQLGPTRDLGGGSTDDCIADELPMATAAECSADSIADTVAEQGETACLSISAVAPCTSAVAAAEAFSSQQYGSSSFESYGGSMRMQQQLPRAVLQQKLAVAKQELDALSTHIDAMMIGYAIQALHSSKDKVKQAAIHQQAFKEQKEMAVQKQQLMEQVLGLQQQLGLRSSLGDSDFTTADEEQPAEATAAAFLVQAAAAAEAADAAPSKQPVSSTLNRQCQQPEMPVAAAAEVAREENETVEEEAFDTGVHAGSAPLVMPVAEGSSLAAAACWTGVTPSSACEVASSGDEYSEDFEATAVTGADVAGLAAAEAAAGQSSTCSPVMAGHAVAPASTRSSDSLEIKEREVTVLQQQVVREYKKKRLDQQQEALQQLLQQLAEQPIADEADLDRLLAAAGIQLASSAAAGTAPCAAGAGSTSAPPSQQLLQPQLMPAAVATCGDSAKETVAACPDGFGSAGADEPEGIDHTAQQQQEQEVILQLPAAGAALCSASSIACSTSSAAEDDSQQWNPSASQLSQPLLSAADIQVGEPQTPLESAHTTSALNESVQAESAATKPAATEAAAWAVTADAGSVFETSQGYTDDGYCGAVLAVSKRQSAAANIQSNAAVCFDSSASAIRVGAEQVAPAASSTSQPATEPAAAAAAAEGAVEVYSYELTASEVDSELLDDQLVDFELCNLQVDYTTATEVEQHEATPDVDMQQGLQPHGSSVHELQQHSMDFASSVITEEASVPSSSNWAAQTPASRCSAADQAAHAVNTVQSPSNGATPNSSTVAGSIVLACKGWLVETAASSSISSTPVPSVLPLSELQFRQQFRNELTASAKADLQQAQAEHAGLTALALMHGKQDALRQRQNASHFMQLGAVATADAVACDAPELNQQHPIPTQQSIASAVSESVADSVVEEESLVAAACGWDSEQVVLGAGCELNAHLQQQQQTEAFCAAAVDASRLISKGDVAALHIAQQEVPAAAAAAAAVAVAAEQAADQPGFTSSAAMAAEQGAEQGLPTIHGTVAANVVDSSSTVSRALMRSSTTSSQDEGNITVAHGDCGRVTADSIHLEYSDWTMDQQDFRRLSYDLTADAMPARLPVEPAPDVDLCASSGAASAVSAAAVAPAAQHANAGVEEGIADAASSCSLGFDSAVRQLALEAGGAAADGAAAVPADTLPAPQLPSVVVGQAAAEQGGEAEQSYSYSMDFDSMSLQQSLLNCVANNAALSIAPTITGAAVSSTNASALEAAVQGPMSSPTANELQAASPASSSSSVSPDKARRSDPMTEELICKQRLRVQAAAQPLHEQEQQLTSSNIADAICTSTLDNMLHDVLLDAMHMWGSSTAQHQQEPSAGILQLHTQQHEQHQEQQQLQQCVLGTGVSGASASSVESADTTDTADSSASSRSIQLDWQSSPGSPPVHLSPLSMRAAAAASAVPASGSIVTAVSISSSSPAAGAAASSRGLMSHPPTDWTPMSDELATPWSVEATASSRFGAASSMTATTDEDGLGLTSTVRQLDSLLMQVAAESGTAESQQHQQQYNSGGVLEVAGSSASPSVQDASCDGDNSTPAAPAIGVAVESEAEVLALSSTRDSAGAADEFDWPDAEEASIASSSSVVSITAAAPVQRRTSTPPAVVVDDSPAHTIEYVQSVLDTQAGPPIHLPEVLALGEEPLGLDRYLWLEKDGRPDMSKLPDGSDSDDRHIHHKALYDATNQAIMQLYAAANRVQLHPVCKAAGPGRILQPLPSRQQMTAQVSAKVAGWAKMRVRDELILEKLLAEDALEDEKTWANRLAEIAEIALEVERGIWEDLLADTAATLVAL